ncbi:MAG: type IV pilus twitching motility protein PilT, partial [Planctomycetaceae bacterium]
MRSISLAATPGDETGNRESPEFRSDGILNRILQAAVRHHASDVHLVRGLPPVFRVHGELHSTRGEPLHNDVLNAMLLEVTTEQQRAAFENEWQLCFSQHLPSVGRYRAGVYRRAGCPEFSIRLCETAVRSAESLCLPPVVEELSRRGSGLVLVTGPTGVGKTTTLNFMVHAVNSQRRAKIVTIEDPIEYVHRNIRSMVIQQEVGTDVKSFRTALV